MNEIGEKYLPIGTVVMLKEATKRLMITGFCSVEEDKQEKMWDYSGCMYPEGFLTSTQTALFDHEQIDEVFHMGLIDEEEQEFKNQIQEFLSNQSETLTTFTPVQDEE